jgi:hypothetical protein
MMTKVLIMTINMPGESIKLKIKIIIELAKAMISETNKAS